MKEMGFSAADDKWRAVYAFDSETNAIALITGDKSGDGKKGFHKQSIPNADTRFPTIWKA